MKYEEREAECREKELKERGRGGKRFLRDNEP